MKILLALIRASKGVGEKEERGTAAPTGAKAEESRELQKSLGDV